MSNESERGSALLTATQRAYLRGNYDRKPNSKKKLRGRMRDRIRHSILDFALLAEELDPDDRERVFSPSYYPLGESDGRLYDDRFVEFVRNYPSDTVGTPNEGYIHQRSGVDTDSLEHIDLIDGLHNALGFLYTATEDAGIPFDSFLETAIKRSLDLDPRRYEVDVETSVKILPPEPDVDTVMEKVQNDRQLTDTEFRVLMMSGRLDPERIIEHQKEQANEGPGSIELTPEDLPDLSLEDDATPDEEQSGSEGE